MIQPICRHVHDRRYTRQPDASMALRSTIALRTIDETRIASQGALVRPPFRITHAPMQMSIRLPLHLDRRLHPSSFEDRRFTHRRDGSIDIGRPDSNWHLPSMHVVGLVDPIGTTIVCIELATMLLNKDHRLGLAMPHRPEIGMRMLLRSDGDGVGSLGYGSHSASEWRGGGGCCRCWCCLWYNTHIEVRWRWFH